jgi:hypothetical protein
LFGIGLFPQDCILHPDEDPILDEALLPSHLSLYRFPMRIEGFSNDVLIVLETQPSKDFWQVTLSETIETSVIEKLNSELKYATIEELVETLVNPAQHDSEFTDAFLFTYQTLLTPEVSVLCVVFITVWLACVDWISNIWTHSPARLHESKLSCQSIVLLRLFFCVIFVHSTNRICFRKWKPNSSRIGATSPILTSCRKVFGSDKCSVRSSSES